jgi:dTDP-4-amino-4,6-dideoxygalactose transaminase/CBS domain-containing protein
LASNLLNYHYEIHKYQISDKSTLIDVLELLNLSEIKIVLIKNEAGQLIRTITDGDIRRAILNGTKLDAPISKLPNKSPITAQIDSSESMIREKMSENNIYTVVLTDNEQKPVALANTDKIQSLTYLSPPHLGSSEISYMMDAIDNNWVAPAGPHLKTFEHYLAKTVDRKYSCALSSGTAAIHLGLRALDIKQSDIVYVSDLTFAASLQPILYQNAQPILIDSEPSSWNMAPSALKRTLSRDKKLDLLPKAIIVVHVYGQIAEMQKIMAIAAEYNIPVIEDAAESLGAQVDYPKDYKKPLLSTYSFNGNKIITTSSGGAVATDDETLRNKIEKLATQGRDAAEHYQHSTIAYNYRMSNLLAGIGIGQLEVLKKRVDRRIEIYERYKSNFSEYRGIDFQQNSPNTVGNRWLSVIKFDPKLIDVHPYRVMRKLRTFGIETRPSWKPMHLQPLCRDFEFIPYSDTQVVSSDLFFTGLCLPSGSSMSNEDVDYVIDKTLKAITGD